MCCFRHSCAQKRVLAKGTVPPWGQIWPPRMHSMSSAVPGWFLPSVAVCARSFPRARPRVPGSGSPRSRGRGPAPLAQGAARGARARRAGMAAAAAALLGRAAGLGLGLVAAAGGRRLLRCGTGAALRERGAGSLLGRAAVCGAGGAAERCMSRGISSDQRPKRPLTAYLRFLMDNRSAFREKNPGTRFEGTRARC